MRENNLDFLMHECNAHINFLSISILKYWDIRVSPAEHARECERGMRRKEGVKGVFIGSELGACVSA
jgi:hypothetical protein